VIAILGSEYTSKGSECGKGSPKYIRVELYFLIVSVNKFGVISLCSKVSDSVCGHSCNVQVLMECVTQVAVTVVL